jgi:predicted nucleotidyltransferase
MLTPEDHIQGLTKMIAAHEGVKRVILFGSRARGTASPRSDIDLAVEGDETVDWTNMWLEVEDYPTLLEIDLVPMHQITGVFAQRVARDGKVLYARN